MNIRFMVAIFSAYHRPKVCIWKIQIDTKKSKMGAFMSHKLSLQKVKYIPDYLGNDPTKSHVHYCIFTSTLGAL